MSHQVEPGAVAGPAGPVPAAGPVPTQHAFVPQTPGTPVIAPEPFHGRAVSWVAIAIIIAGFLIGGLALAIGPTWWGFWLGVAVAVVGLLATVAFNVFDDWY